MKQSKLIHIYLFGESIIQFDNKRYELKRKSLGIFVYLVVQNRPVGRRELTSLFWPNVETVKGLQSLSALLYRYPDPIKKCLNIQDQSIKFKPEHVWLDLIQFQENINFANQVWQNEKALKKTVRNLLEQSVDLYTGALVEDFYLKDHDEFMGWLVKERELFKQQAADTLTRLLRYAYQHANITESIRLTHDLLRIAPFDEDAHMVLIKLLVDDGQKDQAIIHFQTFQEKLSKELNATPGRQITTYYQELYNPVLVPKERRVAEADFKLLHDKPIQIDRQKTVQIHHPFTPPSSLPSVVVKLFGRQRLITQLEKEIVSADNRLITLTGMGGIGKTQLALSVGNRIVSEFKDGAVYVQLRSVDLIDAPDSKEDRAKQISDQLAIQTLNSLNIPVNSDIPPFFQLIEALGRREFLLLYDSFEHLIEGASFFTTLLHAAAEVTILVTSRIRLNQPGERIVLVPPLMATAEDGTHHELELGSGVQLFIDRAKRLNGQLEYGEVDLSAIQTICTLTGGLPLAIEQAASWVMHYSLAEIVDEIHQRYTFLENTAVPLDDPHRSVKSTLERSWNLLTHDEQQMLHVLSLFKNEFSRKAALSISKGSISTLISLSDRTLINQIQSGWYNLHPLVSQLIQDKQEKGAKFGIDKIRANFASYFLTILAEWEADHTLSKKMDYPLLVYVERIKDDIFQAWRWGVENRHYAQLAQGSNALSKLYKLTDGFGPLEQMLEQSYTQLAKQMPDHAKHIDHSPAEYTNAFTQITFHFTHTLMYLGRNSSVHQILIQSLDLLKDTDFYRTHAATYMRLATYHLLQRRKDLSDPFFQFALEKAQLVTDSWDLASLKFEFAHYYRVTEQFEKATREAYLAIGLLADEECLPARAPFYMLLAQIKGRHGHFAEAINIIDKHIDIENNTNLLIYRFGSVLKSKYLFRVNLADEALETLRKVEQQTRLAGNFYSVTVFYRSSILIQIELALNGEPDHQHLNGIINDAQNWIWWLQLTKEDESSERIWAEASGLMAKATGLALMNQQIDGERAFHQFLSKLSLLQSRPTLLGLLPFIMILASYYFLKINQVKLAAKLMLYLPQQTRLGELEIAYGRLVQFFESQTGQTIEPLPAEQLPQTHDEILQLLIEENVYGHPLSDFLDEGTDDSKIKA